MTEKPLKNYKDKNPDFNDLTEKTEAAYYLNLNKPDYEKLIGMLNSDNNDLKYYALLNIGCFHNEEHARILLSCLKSEDSRVIEASSGLIKELLSNAEYRHVFDNDDFIDALTESIKVHNPKACRNITYALQHFYDILTIMKKLVKIIESGNIYSTYWGLFALENLLNVNTEKINPIIDDLIRLICKTSKYSEYQVRERSAFIVSILKKKEVCKNNPVLSKLKENLLEDSNFYVRNAISTTLRSE